MNVRELIAALKKLPQDLDVRVWDEAEDDYVPVTGAIKESGCPYVDLLIDGDDNSGTVASEEDASPSSRDSDEGGKSQ